MSYILQLKESDSREGVGLLNVTAISFDNRLSLRNPVTRDSFRAILSRRGKTFWIIIQYFIMEYFGFDLIAVIKAAGYVGLFAIIFAETGLFLGFFLPGDSLIFVAGFLASQGFFGPVTLAVILFVAAFTGNMVGYEFGRRVGPKLFSREDSLLFRKDHVTKTKKFYDKYGGKTVMIARFVPIVRTFAPILAGVAEMKYAVFFAYNIAGAALWTIGLVILGYVLGTRVPNIDKYLLPIVLVIVVVSVLPGVWHLYRDRQEMIREKETKGE